MDQNQVYSTEFAIPDQTDELSLDSGMTGWRPFTSPSKIQFLDSLVPQSTATDGYSKIDKNISFPDEKSQITRFPTSSEYQTAERYENIIINTDFLSAIPHARQSKTVKRKLNHEENRLWNANGTTQKLKTYFPFEFIGHASRQSVSQMNPYPTSNKENESLINPTTVTGCVLRKSDMNDGGVFETFFTTQNEQPLPQRKRSKKHSRSKTNSVFAVEQHFEQIRRKHAEFNWDIPDSQNAVKNEGHPQTDVDIQRVPTTPYIEQYSSSPSLYSINDTPLQATVPWMSAPSFGNQYRDQGHGGSQRLAANVYGNGEHSFSSNDALQDPSRGERNISHLYPY